MDMLFEFEDDDGSTLVWCQGRVVAFIKESIDKHVYVCVDLVSRGKGPFAERPDYRVPQLVPPPP